MLFGGTTVALASNVLAGGLRSTPYYDSKVLILTGVALDTTLGQGFWVSAGLTFNTPATIVCAHGEDGT